jgi:hypothetical protein
MMENLLASWPLAVVIIVIACLLIFRSPLSDLISRIRRVGYGNRSIDVSGQASVAVEKQKEPDATAAIITVPAAHMLPPGSELYAPHEEEIRAALTTANLPHDLEKAWLIRLVATTRVQRVHEVNYRIILGSQITLMLAANTSNATTMEKAREIFDQAKVTYPTIYQNFTFEAWIHYPVFVRLLRKEATAAGITLLRITPAGRDFLHYLVDNSLTDAKVG